MAREIGAADPQIDGNIWFSVDHMSAPERDVDTPPINGPRVRC